MKLLRRANKKEPEREQHTFCWCDVCGNELIGSNSFLEDTDLVRYACAKCGTLSEWFFDAPVPLHVRSYEVPALRSAYV